jgi:hypothetical protein
MSVPVECRKDILPCLDGGPAYVELTWKWARQRVVLTEARRRRRGGGIASFTCSRSRILFRAVYVAGVGTDAATIGRTRLRNCIAERLGFGRKVRSVKKVR